MSRRSRAPALLALILLAAFAALTTGAAEPWEGPTDWNGALWSLFARNFLRYGYAPLRFGQAYFSGPKPDELSFYTHHSVAITILLTELYRVFGVHEAVARIATAVATILTAGVLYGCARALYDTRTALAATAAFALCPLTLVFGRMYNHEVFALFWIVACFAAYGRWLATHARRDLALVGACSFLAASTAWPGYYLWPALVIHHRLAVGTGTEHRRLFRVLGALGLLAFGIYAAHGVWLKGPTLFAEIVRACEKGWFSNRVDWGDTFTFRDFVRAQRQRSQAFFTTPIALLAALGVGSAVWRTATERRVALGDGLMLTLLAFGASHLLLFKQEAMGHEYYVYYLLPGVSLAAGLGAALLVAAGALRAVRVTTLAALALLFVATSVRTTTALRAEATEERRFYVALGTWLHAHTAFDDPVALNFLVQGPFVAFYADRGLVESVDAPARLRAEAAPRLLVLRAGKTPHFERFVRRHYPIETVRIGDEDVAVVHLPQARGGVAG